MIRFGPAGNSERFYDEGYKSSLQAPCWLRNLGLTAYEYSFGRGVMLSDETAKKIGREAIDNGIMISAHAPYFINLANPDDEKRKNSFRYIMESAKAVSLMGGDRVIIHVGAVMRYDRFEAIVLCNKGLKTAYQMLDDAGLGNVHLCPETMGKKSQIGDLSETLDFCLIDERLIPCVDFAHLHALTQGGLRSTEDFSDILDTVTTILGPERACHIHIHFSTIEYTSAGEKRHRTFADEGFGPRFEELAPSLIKRACEPTVICESKDTMADDALTMKRIFEALKPVEIA